LRGPLLLVALALAVSAGAGILTSRSLAPAATAPHAPAKAVAAAPSATEPLPGPGRVHILPEQVQQANAAGLIDRPIKSLLDVPKRMTYGDFAWNDQGVPTGPVWVRVDLNSQILSVFRSGHEIGTAVILYGADGVPTPTGKFPILAKLKDHRSATYDGAPMPYTLRLTGDGVSIHGSNVRWGFATHGCIGVPKDFAAKLFAAVRTGDEVLIVSAKRRVRAS
jgi:lipoprotein-anchoring transpeptidase ErfK/SrfK